MCFFDPGGSVDIIRCWYVSALSRCCWRLSGKALRIRVRQLLYIQQEAGVPLFAIEKDIGKHRKWFLFRDSGISERNLY